MRTDNNQQPAAKRQWIGDLKAEEGIKAAFVIKDMSLAAFRNKPGKYLNLRLGDRTGEIAARLWDNAEDTAARLQTGHVALVAGRVEEYQGRRQIIVDGIQPCRPDEYDPADFVPTSRRDREEMLAQLQTNIAEVENPYLGALLEAIFGDERLLARFAVAPGGKTLHHAYRSGLMEHTLNVVELVKKAAELHPRLDRDLLVSAGLLHDLGKIQELEGELSYDYSDEGGFLGHVLLTDRLVTDKIAQMQDFPQDLANLLCHAVVSHHGRREWGAPILPSTPEACALHYADNLDARVQGFQQIVDEHHDNSQHWSRYHPYFERRIFLGFGEADEADSD